MWSSNPIPGHICRQNYNLEGCMHPDVQSSTIYNSRDMDATQVSADRWVIEEDAVNMNSGMPTSHKRGSNNATPRNRDGSRDYHTKQSKSERERQMPHAVTYRRNPKYDTNDHSYRTETDSQLQRTDVVACGKGGKDWEFESSRCQSLSIGWMNNKVLLYSTANSIQYPGISHDD